MRQGTGCVRIARAVCIICIGGLAAAHGAMAIRGYQASRHDRFYTGADGDFIASEMDFSGVGVAYWETTTSDGGISTDVRFGTMVSPSFFLSASHYHAPAGRTLTFYPGNDPAVIPVERTIAGGQRVLDSDLWLGWLEQPVSADIARYEVFRSSGQAFVGQEVLALGRDSTIGTTSQRVGRNLVDGVGTEQDLFAGTDLDTSEQVSVYSYESADVSAVGGDEFRYVGGDSGGPTFITMGGTTTLYGINYFIYAADAIRPEIHDPSLSGSGSTRLPAYIEAVNAIMAGEGSTERLTVVPEPASAWLALTALLWAAARRSRRTL